MKKARHTRLWIPIALLGVSLSALVLRRFVDAQKGGGTKPAFVPDSALAMKPASESVSLVPKAWRDGGIFSDSYEEAFRLLSSLTPEQRAAQIFLARCPQTAQTGRIRQYQPGGFVLFGEDFAGKTKDEVIAAIASYQEAASVPMLMAVDEEGGTVVRISSNPALAPARFGSPQDIYNAGGLEAIRENAAEKNALLRELGLNMNLSPVADVSTDPADYIYRRTLGRGAGETAAYIAFAVERNQEGHIASVLKHFPGYGNNKDTHTGISVDERELDSFRTWDFLPFASGIRAGAEAVLVSHNIVKCMDPQMPASLSAPVHTLLREELGFTGLIMTDDLYMDAVRVYVQGQDPAVRAVLAGNDLIISTEFVEQYEAVLQAVREGVIPQELIDRAAFRVLAMKLHTEIIPPSAE